MRENYPALTTIRSSSRPSYRHLRSLLCLAFLLAAQYPLAAAHLIGGEITYRCLGFSPGTMDSRTYEITINVFRDCAGGGSQFDSPTFSVPMNVTIYQGITEFSTEVLNGPLVESVDVAGSVNNPCIEVPTNICVEQGIYIFQVDLPIVTESYHISYQRCCRNNTITNILNPESAGSTYTIEITPTAQQTCNSSPIFQEYPPAILCVDQPFLYDFSATDADGDLLVYEFCSPILGGGNSGPQMSPNGVAPNPDLPPPYDNVIFQAPIYSASVPLGNEAELTIGATNGIMTGTPQFTGQFVVGVCVSEFRNGELLSTVRRDFQFNVTVCEITVFADIERDSVSADLVPIVTSCGSRQVDFMNLSGLPEFIDSYLWSFDVNGQEISGTTRDFSFEFPDYGTYSGVMIVNPGSGGCTDSTLLEVEVFPELYPDFSFAYDTCEAEAVTFTNLTTTEGGQDVVNSYWQFGDGTEVQQFAPDHFYTTPGNFPVSLAITDENGCQENITKNVNYFPVPDLIVIAPSDFRGCVPADIFFDNLSTPIDENYQFDWDFGDGNSSSALSPTHTYNTPDLYDVSVVITSPIGCETDTTFEELILIEPPPVANFGFQTEELSNFQPEAIITDFSAGAFRWFYDFNGEATYVFPEPRHVFRDTGLAYVTQVVTHPNGCIDSLTRFIDVKPEITFFFPNAFSPNGDGTNDTFLPKGFTRGFQGFRMQIWNRWGEPMFESEDPLLGWNGQKSNVGREQPAGVYLYEAYLTGPRGEPFVYKGFITLIR